ncbi:MAG: hypothetical protein BIP78_0447 [Candidatus Bipolaricaulis sibiricus]|uniref:Uncharacterized protein n=1 Tax=Bipolaricaulis sibiricus TaxID=2501609 RepID=A0A410FT78_BIPS1|nr:MAG: hypothetical protein BIP78_0447 [Candidatus Bipolaricaulis sibiricus]
MARRILGGLLVGMLLWAGSGLAQGEVVLPPAEEEVAVLENAFAQVADFFRGFIIEIKGSLTMLGKRADDLEKAALVLQMGVEGLAERSRAQAGQIADLVSRLMKVHQVIEESIGPKIMELDGRISALERYDLASLERRIAALDKASEALSIRIDNNRAKIEGLELALVASNTSFEERLAVVEEVQLQAAEQREQIEALKAELARLAQAQQAQWSAIFLVPIAVGGLLFLLLSSGS